MQISGSKRINSVIISATTVFSKTPTGPPDPRNPQTPQQQKRNSKNPENPDYPQK